MMGGSQVGSGGYAGWQSACSLYVKALVFVNTVLRVRIVPMLNPKPSMTGIWYKASLHSYPENDARAMLFSSFTLGSTHIIHTLHHLLPLIPSPSIVPSLTCRKICLNSRILNRHAPPNPPLQHRRSIQPPNFLSPSTQLSRVRALSTSLSFRNSISVLVEEPQMFARVAHRLVLPLELTLLGPASFPEEEEPCAVDSPVAQRTQT